MGSGEKPLPFSKRIIMGNQVSRFPRIGMRIVKSAAEDYDVYVRASAGDDVVKFLKREFEPVIWKHRKRTPL